MITVHEEHAKIFKAFCDEKRLRILELLRGGEKCACVLLEQLDVGQSGLSYHMKILVESGVVRAGRKANGRTTKSVKKVVLMLVLCSRN